MGLTGADVFVYTIYAVVIAGVLVAGVFIHQFTDSLWMTVAATLYLMVEVLG